MCFDSAAGVTGGPKKVDGGNMCEKRGVVSCPGVARTVRTLWCCPVRPPDGAPVGPSLARTASSALSEWWRAMRPAFAAV